MNKITGYVIAIIGLIGIAAWSTSDIRAFIENLIKIKLPADNPLLIASIVIIVIGIFLVIKSGKFRSRRRGPEVPIYRGKDVVGFRRV